MNSDADIIVVGAGPAGLSAAAACTIAGARVTVVERGKAAEFRNRNSAEDIGEGVGGAGLFSDGKFSFYPSATKLWGIEPRGTLIEAYEWMSAMLKPFGVDMPSFPADNASPPRHEAEDGFRLKEYESYRIALNKRIQLVKALSAGVDVRTGVEVRGMRSYADGMLVELQNVNGESPSSSTMLAKAVIVATGRLGALRALHWLGDAGVFRRLEVGVRVEQRAEAFFLKAVPGLDPKLIAHGRSGVEWRTFCCCRDGEVLGVNSDGIRAVAGRSDAESTGRSNVAFHVRITDPELGGKLTSEMIPALTGRNKDFAIQTDDVNAPTLISVLQDHFGGEITADLVAGLARLQEQFGLHGPMTVYGPSVEGVGAYPVIGLNLQVAGLPVWFPGDVAGLFRGITAAMVSGYFVGRNSVEHVCTL